MDMKIEAITISLISAQQLYVIHIDLRSQHCDSAALNLKSSEEQEFVFLFCFYTSECIMF